MTPARPITDPTPTFGAPVEALALGDVVLRAAAERPDAEALVFPGERLTYRDLAERIVTRARELHAIGVRRGDRVGTLLPNSVDMLATFFAVALLGAVAVPVNTRFRVRELRYVLAHARLSVLVTSDVVDEHVDFVVRLSEAFPQLTENADPQALRLDEAPDLRTVVLLGRRRESGFLSPDALAALAADVPRDAVLDARQSVRLRDPALILFTSGTTAHPKGCLLTHEALFRVWTAVGRRIDVGPDDRVFDPLPFFHLGGLGPAIFSFATGATFVSMLQFDPREALDLIEAERISWLYTMFPPITMGLIHDPSFAGRRLDRVRAVMTVAPIETLEVIRDALPGAQTMCGPFGMTEAGGAITCHAVDGVEHRDKLASTGPPLPGVRIRVVDPETGADLPTGRTGELLVHAPGALEGYLDGPDATAETLDADGWIHSGDLGFVDERGWVSYVGRSKEMIKVGGENVSPLEVEAQLSTHPAIKLAVVVGVPDERLDEVPAAFVELAEGQTLGASDVLDHCRGAIAAFRVPRHVRFVTEWPMSATKVQRSALREALVAELAG